MWLITLTSWGCHAPDDAVVLSRWTLVSESNKPDIAIVLPRYLDELVPRSQPKYTIRTTVERPASWAGQSARFVFPDLDTEVVLRVNGEAAIVTQKPLFGAPIGRGVRQWVVPAATLAKDSTLQRELEAQLFQTQKMDAVGRLAGGVAHDFNNLLSVIIACGEFISEECSDEKARADAMEIVAAGHRAAELTRHLLVFSRKQVLRPKLQSPNLIITELAKMLRRLIGEELSLEIVLDPEVGFVYFDKGQLEQVLVNLVVNARDASPSGGKITVETKLIEMEVSSPGWGIKRSGIRMAISVIDQGVGMTDEGKKKGVRPFLHYQRARQGDRPRLVDGVRRSDPSGRSHPNQLLSRRWLHLHDLPAPLHLQQ